MEETKHRRRTAITVNKWFVILLLLTIPLVNIYFVIYWAFIQKVSQTRRNFARAVILWAIIIALVFVLLIIIFHPHFMSFSSSTPEPNYIKIFQ